MWLEVHVNTNRQRKNRKKSFSCNGCPNHYICTSGHVASQAKFCEPGLSLAASVMATWTFLLHENFYYLQQLIKILLFSHIPKFQWTKQQWDGLARQTFSHCPYCKCSEWKEGRAEVWRKGWDKRREGLETLDKFHFSHHHKSLPCTFTTHCSAVRNKDSNVTKWCAPIFACPTDKS